MSSYALTPPYSKISTIEKIPIQANSLIKANPLTLLFFGFCYLAISKTMNLQGRITESYLAYTIGVTTIICVAKAWLKQVKFFCIDPQLNKLNYHPNQGMNVLCYPKYARSCLHNGKLIAKMAYEIDSYGKQIPVLNFEKNITPKERGYAQGYLLGGQIKLIFEEVLVPTMKLVSIKSGDLFLEECKKIRKNLTIPNEYLQEIKGLIKGVQQYAKEVGISFNATTKIMLNFHCILDAYKGLAKKTLLNQTLGKALVQGIIGKSLYNNLEALGCSATILKVHDGFMIGDNLDWFNFGILGKYLFITRQQKGNKVIESATFPGFIGGLRMLKKNLKNKNELVVSIHTLGDTKKDNGIPSLFYIRYLAENANSVLEVKNLIDTGQLPGSSHHLIVVDPTEAANFQFFPSEDENYSLRSLKMLNLDKKENLKNFLIVTNDYRHPSNHQLIRERKNEATKSSKDRYNAIFKILTNPDGTDNNRTDAVTLISRAQKASQEHLTCVTEIIHLSRSKKQVPTQIVFDERNAANNLV